MSCAFKQYSYLKVVRNLIGMGLLVDLAYVLQSFGPEVTSSVPFIYFSIIINVKTYHIPHGLSFIPLHNDISLKLETVWMCIGRSPVTLVPLVVTDFWKIRSGFFTKNKSAPTKEKEKRPKIQKCSLSPFLFSSGFVFPESFTGPLCFFCYSLPVVARSDRERWLGTLDVNPGPRWDTKTAAEFHVDEAPRVCDWLAMRKITRQAERSGEQGIGDWVFLWSRQLQSGPNGGTQVQQTSKILLSRIRLPAAQLYVVYMGVSGATGRRFASKRTILSMFCFMD